MNIALVAAPVPAAPLSFLQRDYYFYLFATRILTVFQHFKEEDFKKFRLLESVHLGLLQLIAFLEQNGHDCSYFAPVSMPGEERNREKVLMHKILDTAHTFDVIGISAITASYPTAAGMAKMIKNEFKQIPLIIGGPHAWACDNSIVENSDFDFVVRQEGEVTCLDLLNAMKQNKPFIDIPGLSFRENNRFIRNPDRPRMNRENLPFPAYEHLEDTILPKELFPYNKVAIPAARVTPTTGCANSCVWCADFWKPSVQKQHLSTFLKEVKYLMHNRDSRYFYLGTHDFFHDIPYAHRIAETIYQASEEIQWEAQTRVNSKVTRNFLKQLKTLGCRCLHIGIESGNQFLLNKMQKNINLEQARKMCEIALEAGIHTHTYWMIGAPYETRETAIKTIQTMRRWLKQGISTSSEINLLVGYPGTRFFNNPQAYDITWQDPDFSHYDGRSIPTFETKYLTKRDLEYLFHRALDEYCDVLSERIGSHDAVLEKLGNRFPHFDPAVMEAVF